MKEEYIAKIKKFINTNLKNEFTLNELADNIGYTSFHLAREFKNATHFTIMEYTRSQRISAAARELEKGGNICDIAMEYCFETHAGFTKAFNDEFGCTPKKFQNHAQKTKIIEKDMINMENAKIVIRHICKDDVNDLWENVYSSMTPRQITEDKILHAIELYKKREGFELVAEIDGKVIMSLPLTKPTWLPLGFVWDNNFTITDGYGDIIMQKLIDETKSQAKMLGIFTLVSAQKKGSESSEAMKTFGFQKVMESNDWEYLMMAI